MADADYFGQESLYDASAEYNKIVFAVEQTLAKKRFGGWVKIIAVHGGGLGPPPTVDVQLMVKQVNGVGESQSHATIYGIPTTRLQAGGVAVINDPVVGDVGFISVADRDSSSLQSNNGEESTPGSYRRNNLADAVYHGHAGLTQSTPTQYLMATPGGGWQLVDSLGNKVISQPGNNALLVVPSPGNFVVLGGDPSKGGSYDWVVTNSGPATNFVKARYA